MLYDETLSTSKENPLVDKQEQPIDNARGRLRAFVVALMMFLVLGVATMAQAQQEVAPDHFDSPIPSQTARNAILGSLRRGTAAHRAKRIGSARRAARVAQRKARSHSGSNPS